MNVLFAVLWRVVAQAIVFAIAGIPLWIFLSARGALNPEGFWENFAALGLGWIVFGGAQIVFGLAGLFASFVLWASIGDTTS